MHKGLECAHTSSVDASSPQSPVRSPRIPKAMEVLHGCSSAALLRWEGNLRTPGQQGVLTLADVIS